MFKVTAPTANLYPLEFGPFPSREAARDCLQSLIPGSPKQEVDRIAKLCIKEIK